MSPPACERLDTPRRVTGGSAPRSPYSLAALISCASYFFFPSRLRRFRPPSPPLRGRGAGGEGEVFRSEKAPSPPAPLPRVRGRGEKVASGQLRLRHAED